MRKALSSGADPDSSFAGKRIIELAAQDRFIDGVKLLLEHGAGVREESIHQMDLMSATDYKINSQEDEETYTEIIKLLIKNGADPIMKDEHGRTPSDEVDKNCFPILYNALMSYKTDG